MRCPFRMKGFDQPDTCDPNCAWRTVNKTGVAMCAVTVIAISSNMALQGDKPYRITAQSENANNEG